MMVFRSYKLRLCAPDGAGRKNRCAVSAPQRKALLSGVREYLGDLYIAGFVKILASAWWVVQFQNQG